MDSFLRPLVQDHVAGTAASHALSIRADWTGEVIAVPKPARTRYRLSIVAVKSLLSASLFDATG